jgi:chaperone modulatory protein CbpM
VSRNHLPPLSGCIVEEEMQFSVVELCRTCAVRRELVVELVQQGVLEPSGSGEESWRFPGSSLRRTRIAMQLQHDLGVNTAGAALALQLMDEITQLRMQLARGRSPHD